MGSFIKYLYLIEYMKKLNLVFVLCAVIFILVGINLLGYSNESGFVLTGKATEIPRNCWLPCPTEINGSPVEIPGGECGPYLPQFCPFVVDDLEDCGVFTDDCQTCGCPEGEDCGGSGTCFEFDPDNPLTETHTECIELPGDEFNCVEFPGEGANECSVDNDCYTSSHMVCIVGESCESAPGPGRNQCDLSGCLPEYLNRCDDYTWDNECQVANEPIYCLDGTFVNDCQICGCPGELLCQEDGNCILPKSGGDFEDLIYLSSVSLDLEKNKYMKRLVENNLRATFEFKKPEAPLLRFISPTIARMSLKLPDKPEIEKVETTGEIQKSPELGKLILIRGLRLSKNGIMFSPGEAKEEFKMLLGLKNNQPYIKLHFSDLP